MNFDEAFAERTGTLFELFLTSNQPKGLVSYARGLATLETDPGSHGGIQGERKVLRTHPGHELVQTFNDRIGAHRETAADQPFDVTRPDALGIAVVAGLPAMRRDRRPVSPYVLELTLASWGGGKLTAELNRVGDVLVGHDPGAPGEQGAYVLAVRYARRPG